MSAGCVRCLKSAWAKRAPWLLLPPPPLVPPPLLPPLLLLPLPLLPLLLPLLLLPVLLPLWVHVFVLCSHPLPCPLWPGLPSLGRP